MASSSASTDSAEENWGGWVVRVRRQGSTQQQQLDAWRVCATRDALPGMRVRRQVLALPTALELPGSALAAAAGPSPPSVGSPGK